MGDATINYIELPATDLGATKAFYEGAFGWEWIDYGPGYTASRTGSVEVALNTESASAPVHEEGSQNAIGPLVLFGTTDLEAVESAVVAAGGELVTAAYEYPGGHRFHFADPSGNVLAAYQSAS